MGVKRKRRRGYTKPLSDRTLSTVAQCGHHTHKTDRDTIEKVQKRAARWINARRDSSIKKWSRSYDESLATNGLSNSYLPVFWGIMGFLCAPRPMYIVTVKGGIMYKPKVSALSSRDRY